MNQWNNGAINQSAGRPTWAEVDLDALGHNFRVIRERVGEEVKVLAAVKANAYGHGAVACSIRLQTEGADWFGVALPERVLSYATPESQNQFCAWVAVGHDRKACAFNRISRQSFIGLKLPKL